MFLLLASHALGVYREWGVLLRAKHVALSVVTQSLYWPATSRWTNFRSAAVWFCGLAFRLNAPGSSRGPSAPLYSEAGWTHCFFWLPHQPLQDPVEMMLGQQQKITLRPDKSSYHLTKELWAQTLEDKSKQTQVNATRNPYPPKNLNVTSCWTMTQRRSN
jgi:hypothetical protein